MPIPKPARPITDSCSLHCLAAFERATAIYKHGARHEAQPWPRLGFRSSSLKMKLSPLETAMPRVLIADKLEAAGVDLLQQSGLEVDNKPGLAPAELKAILPLYDALI